MVDSPQAASKKRSNRKKRTIWFHLHFWTGWVFALPIAVVCLTGALSVFEREIFHWEHKELFQIEPTGAALSPAEAINLLRSAEPKLQVNHLGVPESPKHAYGAYCMEFLPEGKKGTEVFVHPYTGELLRMSDQFSIAKMIIDLHRQFAAGTTGQTLVAVSSAILGVTCIFGLILWWPLRGRTFARAVTRGNALDWHNALGLVVMLPLIIMAITGITFTWGKHVFPLLEKWEGKPSEVAKPEVEPPEDTEKIALDLVLNEVKILFPEGRITGIQPSNWKKQPHAFFLDTADGNLNLYMDPYTGKELMRINKSASQTGLVGWYRSLFGKLHTMGPYGWFARIVWGLFSLVGTVLVLTGLWISVKRWRRPRRRETRVA